jgi:hypothetical protein
VSNAMNLGGLYCINMSEVLDLWSKVNDLYLTDTQAPSKLHLNLAIWLKHNQVAGDFVCHILQKIKIVCLTLFLFEMIL